MELDIAVPVIAPFNLARFSISPQGAKEAGFTGVEVHRFCMTQRQTLDRLCEAEELGLTISVHQSWSIVEAGPRHWHNRVANLLGLLPRPGYRMRDHIPPLGCPVVVYADRISEPGLTENYWFQSASTADEQKRPRITFDSFVKLVRTWRYPVVFDTTHVLELFFKVVGVGHLTEVKDAGLQSVLFETWDTLAPYVREIHLANTIPSKGHTAGANVPLEEGVFDLKGFCRHVWETRREDDFPRIVPEVSPTHLMSRGKYRALRDQVAKFFE